MTCFKDMTKAERENLLAQLENELASFKARDLKLNMARGKPSAEQLDLSMPLLEALTSYEDCISEDGTDCRNYGVLDGLPEAKRLMACMLDDEPENVIVFGNSSLTVMYDTLARCIDFGTGGCAPWANCGAIKWICPAPGYDRHFSVTEAFGIEMIPVPLNENGPDMDLVERLVAENDSVKGIWCVPKYSNPSGVTYSDEVVRRLAEMETAAEDFRIFWDNAYCVHHLFDDVTEQDQLLDIADACIEAGHPDRYFKFASTSKVTFPGAGISAMAASPEIIAETKHQIGPQMIGQDKLNQLRHVRFLRDGAGSPSTWPSTPPSCARSSSWCSRSSGQNWEIGHRTMDQAARRLLHLVRRHRGHRAPNRRARARSRRHDDGRGCHMAGRHRPARCEHPHRPHPAAARRAGRGDGRVRLLREDSRTREASRSAIGPLAPSAVSERHPAQLCANRSNLRCQTKNRPANRLSKRNMRGDSFNEAPSREGEAGHAGRWPHNQDKRAGRAGLNP